MAGWRERLPALWFRPTLAPALWPLLPAATVFRGLVALRRRLYRAGFLTTIDIGVPVVVVGNLTVGGAGKTPLTIWLATRLGELGWRPGVVARGYGGSARSVGVTRDSDPAEVGDEPLLIARRTGLPVFVGRDRVAAAQLLRAVHPDVNVIVCDDGMQHYRLARTVEIAVVDRRGFGNARLLPAGPLREPPERLAEVDALVVNGGVVPAGVPPGSAQRFDMTLDAAEFVALGDAATRCAAAALRGRKLYALAGIGDPARFFARLRAAGLDFEARSFPDHHAYRSEDLAFARGGVLLMTEKDAVKCQALAAGEAWYLPVSANVKPDLAALVLEKMHGRQAA